MTSPHPTSIIAPSDTNAENPTCSRRLQSRMAVSSAPLWLRKATVPGRAMPAAKVALRPVRGLMTPRQFGPTTRMRPRRASASTCRSSAAPASPVSWNPAEMITAAGTPRSAHAPTTPGTAGAGVAITARSTAAGTSAIDG